MHNNVNYCILVTISRESISFRYNRMDGDNRFVDYIQDSGSEMPFAIECVGNEFVIGNSALASTKNLGANAFVNIFDTCKEMKTFRFGGRDELLNKLPFYAIKHYISKILAERFYGEVGTIDNNVSKLPLIFLFTPELDTDKKLFITSPFEKGGYQNICSIGYHQLLLPTIMESLPEKQRSPVAIMVSVDKDDLLLHIYDTKTSSVIDDTIRIVGLGCDPRLKQAADLIWNTLYRYNYQPREPENEILKEAALRFLNSNTKTVNDVLCMSDGSMQPYMLSRDNLDISSIAEGYRIVSHYLDKALSNHDLHIQHCQIILVGNAATDYFENIFNRMPLSVPIKKVLGKEKNLMLVRLLSMVKAVNYEVNKMFTDVKETKISETSLATTTQLSLDDKKYVRVNIADIKAKIRSNDKKGAHLMCESLKTWLAEKQITEWDSELQTLTRNANSINDDRPNVVQKDAEIPTAPKETDTKKVRRKIRRKIADAKALYRNGRMVEAQQSLVEIENCLRTNNIVEFEAELENLKKEYSLANTDNSPKNRQGSKTKETKSEAEILLLKGMFAEAKRVFASKENNSEMAQVCSKLIRAKRNVAQYSSGYESVKRSCNSTSRQNAISELENCKALYKAYNLATDDIEQLILLYKTI